MTEPPPRRDIYVGTAGWSLPTAVRDRFPPGDSLLQRYAGALSLVEINSSFYRSHRRATYERWAAATPAHFRFAVKAPRTITHERRLVAVEEPLEQFLEEASGLGDKLGPVLVQLPPSLAFDSDVAANFFSLWRLRFTGETALEPRHASWFRRGAEALLKQHRIVRVAADPSPVPPAAEAGGWDGFRYTRLHGSPVVYESNYAAAVLRSLATKLMPPAYVVFDNTKFGCATANALDLQALSSGRAGDLSP